MASRSSGQQSYFYGRIEDLVAGLTLETPLGELDLPALPASAAGPDLRHLVLGSEGRLGVISSATVRVRPLPSVDEFHGALFKDWETASQAVRELAQRHGAPLDALSMLRLSDADETEANLHLAGHPTATGIARRVFDLTGFGPARCLLLFGITGEPRAARRTRRVVHDAVRAHAGLPLPLVGKVWSKSRFRTPYLRNTLWELGYALDTLETAVPWSRVVETARDLKHILRYGLAPEDETVLVFAHLSHLYPDGASIYVTYAFRRAASPERTLERWRKLKTAASHAIVAHRGTISHQHGVGADHAPFLIAEKGALGILALDAARRSLDPYDIMNPGKLFEKDTS
jgi:alkyldihydroxyacetonephosphate synthase